MAAYVILISVAILIPVEGDFLLGTLGETTFNIAQQRDQEGWLAI